MTFWTTAKKMIISFRFYADRSHTIIVHIVRGHRKKSKRRRKKQKEESDTGRQRSGQQQKEDNQLVCASINILSASTNHFRFVRSFLLLYQKFHESQTKLLVVQKQRKKTMPTKKLQRETRRKMRIKSQNETQKNRKKKTRNKRQKKERNHRRYWPGCCCCCHRRRFFFHVFHSFLNYFQRVLRFSFSFDVISHFRFSNTLLSLLIRFARLFRHFRTNAICPV